MIRLESPGQSVIGSECWTRGTAAAVWRKGRWIDRVDTAVREGRGKDQCLSERLVYRVEHPGRSKLVNQSARPLNCAPYPYCIQEDPEDPFKYVHNTAHSKYANRHGDTVGNLIIVLENT